MTEVTEVTEKRYHEGRPVVDKHQAAEIANRHSQTGGSAVPKTSAAAFMKATRTGGTATNPAPRPVAWAEGGLALFYEDEVTEWAKKRPGPGRRGARP